MDYMDEAWIVHVDLKRERKTKKKNKSVWCALKRVEHLITALCFDFPECVLSSSTDLLLFLNPCTSL